MYQYDVIETSRLFARLLQTHIMHTLGIRMQWTVATNRNRMRTPSNVIHCRFTEDSDGLLEKWPKDFFIQWCTIECVMNSMILHQPSISLTLSDINGNVLPHEPCKLPLEWVPSKQEEILISHDFLLHKRILPHYHRSILAYNTDEYTVEEGIEEITAQDKSTVFIMGSFSWGVCDQYLPIGMRWADVYHEWREYFLKYSIERYITVS